MTTVTAFSTVSQRKLQMVLNAAARLVVGAGKYQHITSVLRDVLHWLPVCQRILFQVAFAAVDYVRAAAMPTSKMSACRSLTYLVGLITVRLNVMICWIGGSSGQPGLNSASGVFTLQLPPSGTRCRHACLLPPLAVDSLEMG